MRQELHPCLSILLTFVYTFVICLKFHSPCLFLFSSKWESPSRIVHMLIWSNSSYVCKTIYFTFTLLLCVNRSYSFREARHEFYMQKMLSIPKLSCLDFSGTNQDVVIGWNLDTPSSSLLSQPVQFPVQCDPNSLCVFKSFHRISLSVAFVRLPVYYGPPINNSAAFLNGWVLDHHDRVTVSPKSPECWSI